MIRTVSLVLAVSVQGLALGGCELEESGTPDCGAGGDAGPADAPGCNDLLPYRFVRIDDLSTTITEVDPGADIDAVILDKSAGSRFDVDRSECYQQNPDATGAFLHADPTSAVGPPDSFPGWPTDLSTCRQDSGFVSLGGAGGHIIAHMAADIEAGDTLTVLEVGNCDYGGGTAVADPVEVLVGVSRSPTDSHWVSLGTGTGPGVEFTVPALPAVRR